MLISRSVFLGLMAIGYACGAFETLKRDVSLPTENIVGTLVFGAPNRCDSSFACATTDSSGDVTAYCDGAAMVVQSTENRTRAVNFTGCNAVPLSHTGNIKRLQRIDHGSSTETYDASGEGVCDVSLKIETYTDTDVFLAHPGATPETPCPRSEDDLFLWNKLGSQFEVENSEVGPNGYFDNLEGQMSFSPGTYGNGLDMPFYPQDGQSTCKTTFDLSEMTSEKGTIEFWWTAGYDDNAFFGNAGYRTFFEMTDSNIHPPQPNPINGRIVFQNDNYLPSRPDMKFFIQELPSRSYAEVTSSPSFNAFVSGEEIHWACSFDVNGIPGTGGKTMILFKNGIEVTSGTATWVVANLEHLWLGINPVAFSDPSFRQRGYGGAGGVYDNLKVYRSAKTDFSDRFSE